MEVDRGEVILETIRRFSFGNAETAETPAKTSDPHRPSARLSTDSLLSSLSNGRHRQTEQEE
jgi:hypothetical protein